MSRTYRIDAESAYRLQLVSIATRTSLRRLLSEAINRLWEENLDEVARLMPLEGARKEASRFGRKVKKGKSDGSA